MCHETNHRCAGQVQYLQNVSLAVELRRRAEKARQCFGSETELAQGATGGMDLLLLWLNELAPVVQSAK